MEKILIVEDDRKIREELCSALEKKGYACILLEQFEDVVRFNISIALCIFTIL